MVMEGVALSKENSFDSKNINGFGMIWNQSEAKLIVDSTIKFFLKEYNIKSETLNEFICFVHEDDKKNVYNFFNQDFKELYINTEQIKLKYKIKDNTGNTIEFILFGKLIKSNEKYYLISKSYCFLNLKNKFNCNNSLMKIWKEEIQKNDINIIFQSDKITGLPNKYIFNKIVSNILKDMIKNKARASMLIVNIDNFKYINDSYGHDFGDQVLKEISNNLLEIIEGNVLLSRYSGNTFILFKYNILDIQEIIDLGNSIVGKFNIPVIVQQRKIYLTTSIGISLSPDHGIDYNSLLKNAYAAMYEAKKNGKNECDLFNDSISAQSNRVYSLQKGLRTALQNNELYVMFQPKVSLDRSIVNGFEALIRWESNEFGMVSPVEFIPIAESSKMIIQIGSFVLEEVFKKIKCLVNEGYDNFKIAVNLSEMQLREDVVLSDFRKLIKKYGIKPKYIEVEITESMLMKSFDKNIKILEEIKKMGVSIALDDFGTGYSSLNYLTKLPIDALKIDRSFVIDLIDNPKSKCIVENIINLSHQLGIEVVAEGVEEKSQVEYLKAILCDVVQGYYFSKPRMFEAIKNIIGKEI